MPAGYGAAIAPPGFIGFCIRFPDQCEAQANTVTTIAATAWSWQAVTRVNAQVNADIAPEEDIDHYGRPEYWTIPTDGLGDCEDYALTKRKALLAAGYPAGALRIAVVRIWDGERHTVLTVSTDKGDYVLDNLTNDVLPWTEVNYTWLERQDAGNDWNWVALDRPANTLAVAAAQ
jgi:predicted transglutaminase-like cysteine proteinase